MLTREVYARSKESESFSNRGSKISSARHERSEDSECSHVGPTTFVQFVGCFTFRSVRAIYQFCDPFFSATLTAKWR